MNIKSLDKSEYYFGHKACAGCGGALAVRIALKVLGERCISAFPAGCVSAVAFVFPQLALAGNAIISTFAGMASMMTGIAAGLRARGETDFQVVGFAGDGGTADIGIQALSGAIDRNDDILYICYDNEAYMNTGIQKSSLTPTGATTTTTPTGSLSRGNASGKKDMLAIVAANGISYAATASVGYMNDYMEKIEKASKIRGTKYIQVLAPCPTGWGYETANTIELAKLAVDCGVWRLREYENGKFSEKPAKGGNVSEYIRQQGRFSHLSDKEINSISDNLSI